MKIPTTFTQNSDGAALQDANQVNGLSTIKLKEIEKGETGHDSSHHGQ